MLRSHTVCKLVGINKTAVLDRGVGGYPQFVKEGHNENWVPVWLQEQGYQTYYTGKLMNAQNIINYFDPFPKGFTGSVSPQLRDRFSR